LIEKTKPCIYWIVDFDNCLLQFSFWLEHAPRGGTNKIFIYWITITQNIKL